MWNILFTDTLAFRISLHLCGAVSFRWLLLFVPLCFALKITHDQDTFKLSGETSEPFL